MFSGAAAAAGAATAGGSGMWLFSYNKENFQYDTGMRFGRFMMARGFANAQVGQYREDIQGITGATISKMDTWQTVTTLFLAVGAALSCAGRIGLHGSAPPGWFCALYSGCIFMSILFNGCSLWLSMHAALRAQCAAVSLLTRQVRLPIPSLSQIDSARVIASSFEKQKARDMFRVPFMRHPESTPDMPSKDTAAKGKKAHDPQKEFATTARDTVPTWVRDEVIVDKGDGFVGEGGDVHAENEAPTHFKQLMKAQEEWRDYDVYARIAMLYGVVSYLYAVCYYAMGTSMSELRGFWVMWTVPLVFMAAQALIMRLDIIQHGSHRFPKLEWVGHSAPFWVGAAMTIEYRYYYSEAQLGVSWGLALMAIFCHFCMSLRMLDLAWPEEMKQELPEEPGKEWWPRTWRVPSAFTKHLWFITPPKKLEDGQHCLLHEMEDMAKNGGGVVYRRGKKAPTQKPALESVEDEGLIDTTAGQSPFRDFNFKRGNDLPWQLMRLVIAATIVQWCFIMITTSVEIILGPESLLKPPGEPPWIRDTKYRHYTPAMVHLSNNGSLPEGYRLFYASKVPGFADAHTDDAHTADAHAADAHSADSHATAAETTHAVDAHATDGHSTSNDSTQVEGTADGSHGATEDPHSGDAHAADTTGHDEVSTTADPHAAHVTSSEETEAVPDSPHRRLGVKDGLMQELMNALPTLADLADQLKAQNGRPATDPTAELADVRAGFMAAPLKAASVAWPSLFEPQHLACAPHGHRAAAAALTRRGLGAVVPALGSEQVAAEPFALEGITGSIAGAAWMQTGLRVMSAAGRLWECPEEARVAGSWSCRASALPQLPLPENSRLLAAAIVEDSEGHHVALIFDHMPASAFIYRTKNGEWHTAGEAHIPPSAQSRPSLSFDGPHALLVTTNGGDVHRRGLHGHRHMLHSAPAGAAREFRGACIAPGAEQLIRLAVRETATEFGKRWVPELLQMQ